MDRDTFIISVYCSVYCLVEDEFKKLRAVSCGRHAGFTSELRDAEVITMEICGEYFNLHTDKDLFDSFAHHYRHFFPTLSARSLFVRQAANLWQFKAALHRRLTFLRGQAHDPLLAARPHDLNHLEGLVEGLHGIVPADKGFIALPRPPQLAQEQGIRVVTPRKKHMKTSLYPALLVNTSACWRKLVETVGSHLTERFGVNRSRVHDLWHFQHRLIRKVLAHTVAVFLNLKLGRQPLDLDGLVASC